MTDLYRLLEEVAARTPEYHVDEAALTAARRRRRIVRLGPVVVGAVVVAAVTAAWIPLRDTAGPNAPPASAPPSSASPARVGPPDWMPAEVRVATANPPALPADRGVDAAAMTYQACIDWDRPARCTPRMVTSDGTQYLLPVPDSSFIPADGYFSGYSTLSLDGRFFGYSAGSEFRVRELTGTEERRLPGDIRPLIWSVDSRWLVLTERAHPRDGDPLKATLLDVRSGEQRPLSVDSPFSLVGVLASGEVVLTDLGSQRAATPSTGVLRVVDPTSGRHRDVPLDLTSAMRPKERLAMGSGAVMGLAPDGRTVWLRLFLTGPAQGGGTWHASDDLLLLDLASGEVRRRYELPDPVPPSQPDGVFDVRVAHFVPSGGVLVHQMAASRNHEVGWLDPDTGRIQRICRIHGTAELFMLRGDKTL